MPFQAVRDEGQWRFDYPRVYGHAWTDAVIGAASLAFVGVTFLLAFLIALVSFAGLTIGAATPAHAAPRILYYDASQAQEFRAVVDQGRILPELAKDSRVVDAYLGA